MTGSRSDPTGRDYLLKRSRLAKRLGEMATFDRIQIVDDDQFDADVLAGNLRKILGREIVIDIVRSINALHKKWSEALPDLVFLDDRLGHTGNALTTLPLIRKIGFQGPVIVVSGMMTRQRRTAVMQAGAFETLHKDDFETLSLIEILLRVLDAHSQDPRN